MSKTPFEIRLDLLAMSQSILSEQNMNERVRLENDWGLLHEKASIALAKGEDITMPAFPKIPQYNVDEVIEMAKKLNDFVSNSPTKE